MDLRKLPFFIVITGAIITVGLIATLKPILQYRLGPPNLPATATGMALRATSVALAATEVAIAVTRAALEGRVTPETEDGPTPQPSATPLGTGNINWDGLQLDITAVNYDAWPLVQAQNNLNEPPPAGRVMLLVTVRVTKVQGDSTEPIRLMASNFRLIEEDHRVVYTTFGEGTHCGVIPDELDGVVSREITLEGNVCFQVPEGEDNFILVYDNSGSDYPAIYLPLPSR